MPGYAGTLSRGEVRKALKKLRQLGIKPPRVGYCVTISGSIGRDHVELCRHPKSRHIANDTGYQVVGRREHGLSGARRRRRRRR